MSDSEKKEEALTKLELLPHSKTGEEHLAARNKLGQFSNTAAAASEDIARRTIAVAFTPDSTGKTKVEKVLKAQLDVAESNTDPKHLTGISKLVETCDKLAGGEMFRQRVAREDLHAQNPVMKVVINMCVAGPVLYDDDLQKEAAEQMHRKPSWLQAESITTNPAPSAEGVEWNGTSNRRHTNIAVPPQNDRRNR